MGKMRTIKVKLGAFSDWYMSNNSDYAKDEIIDYDITEEIMIILKEINPYISIVIIFFVICIFKTWFLSPCTYNFVSELIGLS